MCVYVFLAEGMLSVHPANVITFVKEGTELVSTVELQNNDAAVNLTYKVSFLQKKSGVRK